MLSAEDLAAIRERAETIQHTWAGMHWVNTGEVPAEMQDVTHLLSHIDAQAEHIAALEAERSLVTERLEVVYRALKKINQHHTRDHHQDDPAMPMDSDVAAGYLAFDNRPRGWWVSALAVPPDSPPAPAPAEVVKGG